jgi:hypothetical protein
MPVIKKLTLIWLCVAFCVLPLFLLGCDKKEEVFITISSDSYTFDLTTGNIYYIPIEFRDLQPGTPFVIQQAPAGSEPVMIEGFHFLKWEPTETGQYKIRISNEANNLAQTYILIVE